MNGTKNPLQSLGVMGPLISLIVIGFNMKWPGLGVTDADVGSLINQVFALVGGVTAIYGRLRATAQITVTGKSIVLALLAGGALTLSACATPPVDPAQPALVGGVQKFNAEIAKIESKLNSGIAAAGADLKMACGGVSWANGLFAIVAPLSGATPEVFAAEALAMVAANAICAQPAPVDIGTAVAQVLGAYSAVKQATVTAAPDLAPAVAATPVPAPAG